MKIPWMRVSIICGLIGTICIIIWLLQLRVLDGYSGFFSELRIVGSVEEMKQRMLVSPFGVIGLIFVIIAFISAEFHSKTEERRKGNEHRRT